MATARKTVQDDTATDETNKPLIPAEAQSDAAKDSKSGEGDKTGPSYMEQADDLARDVRAYADKIREELKDLVDRVRTTNETTPEPAEAQAADGVGRIPTAVADVDRALEGLVHVAADLARQITR